MSDDDKQKPQPRRGFPGGFFVLLLAAVLTFFAVQSLNKEKTGKVGFSHQVEHLVNLDLIDPQASRKTSQNDNLVSFSGQFKERLSNESKERFRFLELLNKSHQLKSEESSLKKNLQELKGNVQSASEWYLALTGIQIPSGGFIVVSSIYDLPSFESHVVVQSPPNLEIVSLRELEAQYASLSQGTNGGKLSSFGKNLLNLIRGFRSPSLGIGNEGIKQQLRDLEAQLREGANFSSKDQMILYASTLATLREVSNQIGSSEEGISLLSLRSVRSYRTDLDHLKEITSALNSNIAQLDKARQAVSQVVWFFNNKELSTRALEQQDPEAFSQWFASAQKEWQNFPANQGSSFKAPDQPRNAVLEKTFKSEGSSPNYFSYFLTLLPALLIIFLLYFVFSRQMKGVGANAMSFGKSPARMLTKERNKTTFKDVAGADEAKEELQEIVEFLKDPSKFTALGARIPKGVLCIGAPGTGKTLIAKAVAGEADRPFFFISGSDFVEMFVGVGASRIRDLFGEAKKHAPCIVFIDEIDAVGRHRGGGIGGGHDEREQTLNQLLVEMDGFDSSEGVILIAATNRPDVLDKALLRPGRFDRRVVIDLPDIKGRYEILKVHARKIKLDPSVELMDIARNTPGASGADLANILNEAALLAARAGRTAVTSVEAKEACDKVRYGKERRSLEIDIKEKRTTAIHESGHAVVGLVVEHADPVDKVTIIPRGLSLGATHFMPKKNRLNYWRREIIDQLAVLMGGRVAEEIFIEDMSSGAQMDITQATRLVRSMVCEWGMTETLGAVAYDERGEAGQYLGMPNLQEKNYSEETAKLIDEEVRRLLDAAHKQAAQIIEENREKVQLMTDMLMEFETLDRQDVREIMDGTWNIDKKRGRLKAETDMMRKTPPPPPPKKEVADPNIDLTDPSPQGT